MISPRHIDLADSRDSIGLSDHWQVVVIGAGPTGCAAAIAAARLGLRTLLVETKSFPRPKVCGGCLNSKAWRQLEELGLAAALTAAGAIPVAETRITNGRRAVVVPLAGGSAVSRYVLDDLMLQQARAAGVTVFEETQGVLLESDAPASGTESTSVGHHMAQRHTIDRICIREMSVATQRIELRSRRFLDENQVSNAHNTVLPAGCNPRGSEIASPRYGIDTRVVAADAVVVADGLLRSSLRNMRGFRVHTSESARVGVGTVLATDPVAEWDRDYPAGRITMVVGNGGYVGLTQIEDGRLNIAASIDASVLKTSNAAAAVSYVLKSASQPIPAGLQSAGWTGTPALTSTISPFAAGRVFVLGDSASYAEPFTGEGMAWGMESAAAVAPFLMRCCREPSPGIAAEWNRLQQRETKRREWLCRKLSAISRFPGMVDFSLQLAKYVPGFTRWCVSQLNRGDDRNRTARTSSANFAGTL